MEQIFENFIPLFNKSADCTIDGEISAFFSKIPTILGKFPQAFVCQIGDSPNTLLKKDRFVHWMFHKLLMFRLKNVDQNCPSEIEKIDSIIKGLYQLVANYDLELFQKVSKAFLKLLNDLIEASDLLFEDQEGCREIVTNVKGFGNRQETSPDDAFATANNPFIFDNPFVVDKMQGCVVKQLRHVSDSIFQNSVDITLNGLWPLLIRQLNFGELELKCQCLHLLSTMIKVDGPHPSSNIQWELISLIFQLLKGVHRQTKDLNSGQPINRYENLVQGLVQILMSLEKSVRKQNTLRTICNHHTMTLWSALLDHTDKKMNFCDELKIALRPFFDNVSTNIVIKEQMLEKFEDFGMVKEAFVHSVHEQIVNSGFWSQENEKLLKIDEGKSTRRLETVKIYEESLNWRKMISTLNLDDLGVSNMMGKLISLSTTSMKILARVQGPFKVAQVEFDFYGKKLTQDILEYLFQELISNPLAYGDILDVLESLIMVQTKDTFTQNALNQIVALASASWLGTESKPKDLLLSQTLTHNLIRISERIPKNVKSFYILSLIMKDVAPIWRKFVLRKSFSEGTSMTNYSIINYLDIFVHNMGPSSHALVLELLKNEHLDTDMIKILSVKSGSIFCSFAKQTKICRLAQEDGKITEVVKCRICTTDTEQELGNATSPTTNHSEQLNTLFVEVFQKFIGHEDKIVQKNLIISLLKPMFKHHVIDTTIASLWLLLLENAEAEVAFVFSKHITYLIGQQDVVLDRLIECKQRALEENDKCLFQEVLCQCIKNFCQIIEFISVGNQFKLLELSLDLLMDHRTHLSAYTIGKEIRDLLNLHPKEAAKKIANVICEDGKEPNIIESYVHVIFTKVSFDIFLRRMLPTLLATIICKVPHIDVKPILNYLAEAVSHKTKKILFDEIGTIYPAVVTQIENTKEYLACVKFLEDEIGFDIKKLVNNNRQKIIIELLVLFHSHASRVTGAFKFLAKHDDEFKCDGKKFTKEDMANYIKPRFLGVLNYFARSLRGDEVGSRQMDILKSLSDIIRLMGSENISLVKCTILSTLKTGLEVSGVSLKALVQIWDSFVRTIDVNSLRPILAQVFANLLQLYQMVTEKNNDPDQNSNRTLILKIFDHIIIDHKKTLARKPNAFAMINFIPEIPEFVKHNQIIREENFITDDQEDQFRSVLKLFSLSLMNENNDVWALTLDKLNEILQLNQIKIHAMISSNEETDPTISQLIQLLMNCARCSDKNVTILAGACLGILGAIDPGRLNLVEDLKSGKKTTYLTVEDREFVLDLIDVLEKAYLRTSDSNEGDSCSYSLQEILVAYQISDTAKMSTVGGVVWNQLKDSTKEILRPLFFSKYTYKVTETKLQVPIYGSCKGQNYSDWISSWSSHLISKIGKPKIATIFNACKPALKKDPGCAQFLLPYILIYVLCHGTSEHQKEIHDEIDAIIGTEQERSHRVTTLNGSILAEQKQNIIAQDLGWMAKQTIFTVLDHMKKWLIKKYESMASGRVKNMEEEIGKHPDYIAVKKFVNSIKKHDLAIASFECRAYARSLMHLEEHLRDNEKDFEQCMTKLQQVYGALDEPDYVNGLAKIRSKKPTLEELIHQHQVTGNFQDALSCYESLGKTMKDSLELKSGLLKCYLEMDQPHSASTLAKGLVAKDPDNEQELLKYQIEAAWQLGQWQEIEDNCSKIETRDWSSNLGELLLSAQKQNLDTLQRQVDNLKKEQIIPIAAAVMEQGAYRRCYEYVVRLQILDEIESFAKIEPTAENMENMFMQWKTRLEYSQYSLSNLEPVLKIRRTLLNLGTEQFPSLKIVLKNQLGECWLTSAKVARKAGQLNKAYSLLLEAEKFNHQEVFIERAKICWAREKNTEAISVLEKGLLDQFQNATDVSKLTLDEKTICSKAKLLRARYIDEAANLGADLVFGCYQETVKIDGKSEEVYMQMARSFEKFIPKNYIGSDLDVHGDKVYHIISFYAKSVIFGSTHLHHSMPRLLSLWLDYGSRVQINQQTSKHSKEVVALMKKNLNKINDLIQKLVDRAPSYCFLSVIPQLTSRICHPHDEVWNILKNALIKTFLNFPQHAFWYMVALLKSKDSKRTIRCDQIFQTVLSSQHEQVIDDSRRLTDYLLQLCDKKLVSGECTLRESMEPLYQLFQAGRKRISEKVLLPTMDNMTYPTRFQVNSFPEDLVYASGIEDCITVMRSAVMPKKITFRGSNGKKYSFLCKPKDDLRRDCRLLDFNNLLNKLFLKDPESRKRNLHLRTYSVFPLNETNGIIEWIDNLMPMRGIVMKLVKEKYGVTKISPELQTVPGDVVGNKKKFDTLLKYHPPVFADWFVRNFPDPQSWFMARLAYIRTTAAMSMVGYLLGLGDRHGENILFDTTNGDTIHVDLNMLFDKGHQLRVPETVPFRLTQNMVQAMGPTGTEGPFRIACEVSLGLMRKQKDDLMAALRPFLDDPLADWVKESKTNKRMTTGEMFNEKAIETLKVIENKLNGLVESKNRNSKTASSSINLPLSVAGQVQYLIDEATSYENLSQMFTGWAPFL